MGTVINYANTFGSKPAKLDLQRVDLFKFTIDLPSGVDRKWTDTVEFAVEKFPFPAREREAIPVKYMQQTNFLIGADTATAPVEVTVRYAFAQATAEALERWNWLISNPVTGGVGLTSAVKTTGYFRWLVPNMPRQIADIQKNAQPGQDTLKDGLVYKLEGCWIKGLKQTDADMTVGNGYVNLLFTLQIDRYYPEDLNAMIKG